MSKNDYFGVETRSVFAPRTFPDEPNVADAGLVATRQDQFERPRHSRPQISLEYYVPARTAPLTPTSPVASPPRTPRPQPL